MKSDQELLTLIEDFIIKKKYHAVNPKGFVAKFTLDFIKANQEFLNPETPPIPPPALKSEPEPVKCPLSVNFIAGVTTELDKITDKDAGPAKQAAIGWAKSYSFDFIDTRKLATDMVQFAIKYSDERIKSLPKPTPAAPSLSSPSPSTKQPTREVTAGSATAKPSSKAPTDHPEMETIEQARDYLRGRMKNGLGSKCPVCTQYVRRYNRPITSAMAYCLILIHKSGKNEFFHVEDWLKEQNCPSSIRGDFAKLRFWGLIEQMEDLKREDESSRVGYYKITPKGVDFVNGVIKVPRSVKIFNNQFFGFSEKETDIKGALKKKFSYSDLMSNLA